MTPATYPELLRYALPFPVRLATFMTSEARELRHSMQEATERQQNAIAGVLQHHSKVTGDLRWNKILNEHDTYHNIMGHLLMEGSELLREMEQQFWQNTKIAPSASLYQIRCGQGVLLMMLTNSETRFFEDNGFPFHRLNPRPDLPIPLFISGLAEIPIPMPEGGYRTYGEIADLADRWEPMLGRKIMPFWVHADSNLVFIPASAWSDRYRWNGWRETDMLAIAHKWAS